jgi:hypothetical protein
MVLPIPIAAASPYETLRSTHTHNHTATLWLSRYAVHRIPRDGERNKKRQVWISINIQMIFYTIDTGPESERTRKTNRIPKGSALQP